MGYLGLLHKTSFDQAETYLHQLQSGELMPGHLLANALNSLTLKTLAPRSFIECLANTKRPQIFAESSVRGDGSDWNQTELAILGDLSMAMDVTVFDNGLHRHPQVHPSPFNALLIYTPGALLRNETGNVPADWQEVVIDNQINYPAFIGLYERRLLPCLIYANDVAHCKGVKAIITLPGLGCGQFAGKFKGQLGSLLKQVLCDLVKKYHTQLPAIRAIYYDPFDECDNERIEMGNISLLVRPLLRGNESKGQLSLPNTFEDVAGEFSDCLLTSLVAWDHVSWPGNDFYIGSRATDDGVKAAATNTMQVMTGCEGRYCLDSNKYLPPKPYDTWDELIAAKKLSLHCNTNLKVYDPRV